MKIKNLHLEQFMLFNAIDIDWSSNINIISGNNNTGKTALLKIMYASSKAFHDVYNGKGEPTKEKCIETLVGKIDGIFRPDDNIVGRLVKRKQGSNRSEVKMLFDNNDSIEYGFGNRQVNRVDLLKTPNFDFKRIESIYIPPKEIISAMENFESLYSEYHIALEEMYYDLSRLLNRPLKKGPNTNEQNAVLGNFESILNGTVLFRNKKFYLYVKDMGLFEMGLVSEGFRKISTIMYLIQNGSLNKNSILFWDEPETNLNPKMIDPIVRALIELAKMGVQIFITTHDYFVQQGFNMAASYPQPKQKPLIYNFISLYKEDENEVIQYECAKTLNELIHNPVLQEFDDLYNKEQEILNADN